MAACCSLLGIAGCTTILGFDKDVESADEAFSEGGSRTKPSPEGAPGASDPDGGSPDDLDSSATKKDSGEPPTEPYLDETFGHRGRVEVRAAIPISVNNPSFTSTQCSLDVAVDTGSWVACGNKDEMSHQLARLAPNGDVDLAFVADGGASPLGKASIGGIAAQGEKLLIGEANSTGAVMVVRREVDGGSDPTFATDGALVQASQRSLFSMTGNGEDLLLTGNGGSGEMAVTRLLRASNTFSTTVLKSQGSVSCFYWLCKSFVLSDGRIVALGTVSGTSARVYGFVRFVDGNVDTTFGTGGVVRYPADAGTATIIADAAEADGQDRIVVSGFDASGSYGLARFTKDGMLDPAFGDGGISTFAVPKLGTPPTAATRIFAITPLRNDRFYVGGTYRFPSGDYHLFVARLNTNGSVDTTFATQGYAFPVLHQDAQLEMVKALKLTPNGKLLAAGLTSNGGMFVLRFKLDP